MALDPAEIRATIEKLRKALKKTSRRAAPDRVHKLRTRVRRFEAIVGALPSVSSRKLRHILRPINRLRKQAGQVRDTDVLTAHLCGVRAHDEEN